MMMMLMMDQRSEGRFRGHGAVGMRTQSNIQTLQNTKLNETCKPKIVNVANGNNTNNVSNGDNTKNEANETEQSNHVTGESIIASAPNASFASPSNTSQPGRTSVYSPTPFEQAGLNQARLSQIQPTNI